jgi:hypothetical protein
VPGRVVPGLERYHDSSAERRNQGGCQRRRSATPTEPRLGVIGKLPSASNNITNSSATALGVFCFHCQAR